MSVAGNVTASPDQGNFKVGFVGTYSLSGLSPEPGWQEPYFGNIGTIGYVGELGPIGSTVPEGSYANAFEAAVVGLNGKGDKGTITLTIKNGSTDIDAVLSANAYFRTDLGKEYFRITPKLGTTTLVAGQSTTLVLEIECIKTPVEEEIRETMLCDIIASPINA